MVFVSMVLSQNEFFMFSMRPLAILRLVAGCFLISGVAGSAARCQAEVITQIPDPFVTETFMTQPGALSQFDTTATGTELQAFATVYDNFTLSTATKLVGFSWVGFYEEILGPQVDFLTVSVYADNAGEPALAPLASYNVGLASETAIPGFDGFYEYNASISPLAVTPGQTYWFSVVGTVGFLDNGWGIAFSDIGDDLSVQDFQVNITDPATTRFTDPIDYAFSVTAVPEPSSLAALAIFAGAGAVWRRRAKKTSVASAA